MIYHTRRLCATGRASSGLQLNPVPLAGRGESIGTIWHGMAISRELPPMPVSASDLYRTEVPPCAAGYAHPSICCQGAPYEATVCTLRNRLVVPVASAGLQSMQRPRARLLRHPVPQRLVRPDDWTGRHVLSDSFEWADPMFLASHLDRQHGGRGREVGFLEVHLCFGHVHVFGQRNRRSDLNQPRTAATPEPSGARVRSMRRFLVRFSAPSTVNATEARFPQDEDDGPRIAQTEVPGALAPTSHAAAPRPKA